MTNIQNAFSYNKQAITYTLEHPQLATTLVCLKLGAKAEKWTLCPQQYIYLLSVEGVDYEHIYEAYTNLSDQYPIELVQFYLMIRKSGKFLRKLDKNTYKMYDNGVKYENNEHAYTVRVLGGQQNLIEELEKMEGIDRICIMRNMDHMMLDIK